MSKEFKEFCPTQLLCSREDTADLEYQEGLPQYCEDVERIIKCTCNNVVTDYENLNGTLKVYGKSRICLAYVTASNTCTEAEFEETFVKNIECPITDNFAFARIESYTRFTNFRLINQRKVAIHSSICISSKVFEQKMFTTLSNCDDAITKEDDVTDLSIISCGAISADFDEEFSIAQSNSPVESIINTYSTVVVRETKTIKDKMLIKCTVQLSVTYQDEAGNIEKGSFDINISKIIDVSSVDTEDISFVNSSVSSLYVKAAPDDSNNMRRLSIAGSVHFAYCVTRIVNESFITDAYSTKFHSSIDANTTSLMTEPRYFADSKTVVAACDSEDVDLREIIDMSVKVLRTYINESNIIAEISADILYYDSQSSVVSSVIKSSISIPLDESHDEGFAFAELLSFDYVMKSSHSIELRLNIDYGAYLYKTKKVNFIKDIDVDKSVSEETPVLTIYFANENETVWDIAKKFKTNASLIMKENDITNETIMTRRILLVPGV